ncbi:MAG TPA: bifunctional methylenetetrahydrofolate dehydrogenase/methenyltetrahydrofolate cyclohydrolase FolD [Bacteroidota bacterium]|jgi:methylenetetrahydrofolate dehydrogenase (NADP+)/methenyltetrahydrofolate cyclohydrolase
MGAAIIDGRKIARDIRAEVKAATEILRTNRNITPGLAFIIVGDNPASQVYVRAKEKACTEMGFHSVTERLPATTTETELLVLIKRFNADATLHGILVQLPLPSHISEHTVIEAIDYRKDVDGFHPVNVGRLVIGQPSLRPCTPAGVQELLTRSGNDPAGKHVVVLGRSNIVGKPLANILLQKQSGANAVVTIAHTGAKDFAAFTTKADIVVAAIGRPEMLTGAMLRKGCVVIDVGINRIPDQSTASGYRLVGDVHFQSAEKIASAITPVPGGVGPMTIALLMRNTLLAAEGTLYG